MKKNISKYKRDWFLQLSSKELPISTYLVRRSLLAAVTELKPILHGKVLDLACGIMPYKDFLLSDKIEQYIGVDLEPTEYHHDVKPDLYWNGSEIPLQDSSVDFVLATEFLEHYFDTASVLKEIRRVLKPEGILFFTVPTVWPIHEAPYDYHRFSPFALEEHFKKAQFSDSNIKSLGGPYYYFAISIGLFFEFRLAEKYRKIIKPLLNLYINALVKKDDKREKIPFKNGQMNAGLYGFITK